MLYAYNPSKDRDVIVNSVFTATRHFHVSPVHSRVSCGVVLENIQWQSASVSCFPWPKALVLWFSFLAFPVSLIVHSVGTWY